MTAKEFLSRGILLDKRINTKWEQIQCLRDLQTNISATLSHTNFRKSGRNDRVGDITARVLDLIDEYEAEVTELLIVKGEIRCAIAGVEREEYKYLLSLRYESYMAWEKIACEMGYAYQHVHRLHNEALKHVIVCDTLDMI